MSSEDQVRPYHAKDEARGQEAAEAVAAVLKHAAEKEKSAHTRPRKKSQSKWLLPVGVNLAVLAGYLLLAPPAWVTMNPIEAPPPEVQVSGLKRALWLQAQRIDTYRIQNGRLPETLDQAGTPTPGVEYIRQGTEQYQLVAVVGEEAIVWDSAGDNAEILAEAAKLLGG